MIISVCAAATEDIHLWRERYREEMNCQIVHDSIPSRAGWTEQYFLQHAGETVGYGVIAVGGPWKDRPTVIEFYVLPPFRPQAFDLFEALLAASRAVKIEVQTNDSLLTVMLHAFADQIASEKIVFEDKLTTTLAWPGATLRAAGETEKEGGDWILEVDGAAAASGGILYHYNRPYGDIYMEVAEPFRRRGLGAYLVQELKRICYELGSVPCARCDPQNLASRRTLQKAGFAPCAQILCGLVAPTDHKAS